MRRFLLPVFVVKDGREQSHAGASVTQPSHAMVAVLCTHIRTHHTFTLCLQQVQPGCLHLSSHHGRMHSHFEHRQYSTAMGVALFTRACKPYASSVGQTSGTPPAQGWLVLPPVVKRIKESVFLSASRTFSLLVPFTAHFRVSYSCPTLLCRKNHWHHLPLWVGVSHPPALRSPVIFWSIFLSAQMIPAVAVGLHAPHFQHTTISPTSFMHEMAMFPPLLSSIFSSLHSTLLPLFAACDFLCLPCGSSVIVVSVRQ